MDFDFFQHPLFAPICGPEEDAPAEIQALEADFKSLDVLHAKGDTGGTRPFVALEDEAGD